MIFKKKVIALTILLCIFFSISCVVASDVNDTEIAAYENEDVIASYPQEVVSSGEDELIASSQEDLISSEGQATFTDLQNIISSASSGDTISLDRDYTYDEGFNEGRGIVILKDLTINGNGHTLNGLSKSRILFAMFGVLNNNKVTLNNIVFKNGYTSLYGGAIFNFADLTVNNCVFENNYAGTTAGAICSVGSLDCKNSVFNKNTANGDGGAIFSLNMENEMTYFKYYYNQNSNSVDKNGIVNDVKGIVSTLIMDNSFKPLTDKITNCKFSNNVALGRGGGAVYAFSHINIDSSKFTSNRAGQVGGAVYAAKNLNIKNSQFTKNNAAIYGGAVYFKFHEIKGSYDKNGKWTSSVKFYDGSITGCTFNQNTAKNRGGAIYGFKYSEKPSLSAIKVSKSTFKDNQADTYNELYGATLKKCTLKNTITLKTVKVKKSAKKLVLTAKLKKGSKVLKNKKVTFVFNGKKYTAKTNKKGIAKVTVKSKVLKKLRVGATIYYKATYAKLHVKNLAKVYK